MGNELPANGTFCWYELATTDQEASKRFYTELLGWQLKEGDIAGSAYSEIYAGERPIGGMFKMGAEYGGRPPHWMAYVAVADVEAAAKRVEELGGTVCVPPTDIPTVGRFCIINDPAGATLSLITLTGAQT